MKKILFLILLPLSVFSQTRIDSVIVVNTFGDTIRYTTIAKTGTYTNGDSLVSRNTTTRLRASVSPLDLPISTAVQSALDSKQDALISGTNIKTINGIALPGSGNISIVGTPVYAQVTGSNATTTGQALVDITGLAVPLTTNAVYEFEAVLSCQTSAVTTGTAYGVNYSVAGATVEASITGSSTATATKTLRISALNSATALYLAGSGQTGGIIIKGRITTGANAGNLTIQHLKLSSGTSTVIIGSFLKVTRIS